MTKLLRFLFFAVVVRAVILVALGLTGRHRERLPRKGPTLLAANHNSHFDTLALMSLLPLRHRRHGLVRQEHHRHPVARGSGKQSGNPLEACEQVLDLGDILVIFPEGSRGEPEALAAFKKGIGHLAKARPKVPVIPIFMHGLGKALSKGSALFVPFNCLVSVGEPLFGNKSHDAFVVELEAWLTALAAEEKLPAWE